MYEERMKGRKQLCFVFKKIQLIKYLNHTSNVAQDNLLLHYDRISNISHTHTTTKDYASTKLFPTPSSLALAYNETNQMEPINLLKYHATQKGSQISNTHGVSLT